MAGVLKLFIRNIGERDRLEKGFGTTNACVLGSDNARRVEARLF